MVSAYNVLKSFSTSRLGSLCLANTYENILDTKSSLSTHSFGCSRNFTKGKKSKISATVERRKIHVGQVASVNAVKMTDTESDSDSSGAECLETEIVMTSRKQSTPTTWNFR